MKHLETRNLTIRYDGQRATIDNLSISFKKEAVNLVLGPSGSGKSTLCYSLNGLLPGSIPAELEGEILLEGETTRDKDASQLASQIGLVFQDPDTQFATYTVEDELVFGMENLNFEIPRIEENLNKYIRLLNLEHLRTRSLNALSGGEKQRVAIASILTLEPDIVIFDEPSSNLDVETKTYLFEIIDQLKKKHHKTIIIIEHNLDELIESTDHVIVLGKQGKAQLEGSPEEVLRELIKPENNTGISLPEGLRLFRERQMEIPAPLPVTREEITEYCRHNKISDLRELYCPKKLEDSQKDIMTCRNLEYKIGHRKIIDNLSFDVKERDFLAILGPNGAGKSTLSQLMAGLKPEYKGEITLYDKNIRKYKKKDLWHKLGLVFQNPEWQFTSYLVKDELMYSLKRFHISKEEKLEKIEYFLKKFNLEDKLEANPYQLSQGQKRRLSVATMLIAGQEILILDEPTFGQDQESLDNLLEYICHLNENEGIAVMMITHDMELVSQYCKRALVLAEGRKIFEGRTEDLFENEKAIKEGKLSKPFFKEIEEGLETNGIQ